MPEESLCLSNIGPLQRRRRWILGVVGFGAGVLSLAALVVLVPNRWPRLVVALPFLIGSLGVLQARAKT